MGLITVAEYKASHLLANASIGGAFSPDELQAFIDSASDTFESDCYQSIGAANEVEVLELGTQRAAVDNRGVLTITPRFFPIRDVNSIKWRVDPSVSWTDAQSFGATAWSVQDFASKNYSWGAVIRIPIVNPFSRSLWAEVSIDYDYGYIDVPGDVKEAVIIMTLAYASMGMAAIVYSPTDGGQSQTPYSFVPGWANTRYKNIVSRYRRNF